MWFKQKTLILNKNDQKEWLKFPRPPPGRWNHYLSGVVCVLGFSIIFSLMLYFALQEYQEDSGQEITTGNRSNFSYYSRDGCSKETNDCSILCNEFNNTVGDFLSETLDNIYEILFFNTCTQSLLDLTLIDTILLNNAISVGWIQNVSFFIEKLSITGAVEYIEPQAFNDNAFSKLQNLKISDFNLKNIVAGSFAGLRTLVFLTILNSNIENIEKDVFKPFTTTISNLEIQESTIDLRQITGNLDVQNAQILQIYRVTPMDVITSEYFYGMRFTRSLYIYSNGIETIEANAFANMQALQLIHLNDNNLRTLSRNVFYQYMELPKMFLSGNLWNCNCELQWIKESILQNYTQDEPVCSSPREHEFKRIRDVILCPETTDSTAVTPSTTRSPTIPSSSSSSSTILSSSSKTTELFTTPATIPDKTTTSFTDIEATPSITTSPLTTTTSKITTESEITSISTEETTITSPSISTSTTLSHTVETTTFPSTTETEVTTPPTISTDGFVQITCKARGNLSFNDRGGRNRRKLLSTMGLILSQQSLNFSVVDAESGQVYLFIRSALKDTDILIWFIGHLDFYGVIEPSTAIGCLTHLSCEMNVDNLIPGETYTFCLLKDGNTKVSPLDCRAHATTATWGLQSWLNNEDKALIIGIVSGALLMCVFAGALLIYLLIRRNPSLLRGSKRIVMVKHRAAEAIVMPPNFEVCDTKKKEERRPPKKGVPNKRSNFRRSASETSILSSRSVAASYVSAVEPTAVQLLHWRLERLRDSPGDSGSPLRSGNSPGVVAPGGLRSGGVGGGSSMPIPVLPTPPPLPPKRPVLPDPPYDYDSLSGISEV